jgi:hypothetical protein
LAQGRDIDIRRDVRASELTDPVFRRLIRLSMRRGCGRQENHQPDHQQANVTSANVT